MCSSDVEVLTFSSPEQSALASVSAKLSISSSGAQTGHVLAALSLNSSFPCPFRVLTFWSSCVLCNLPFHLLLHQLSSPSSNMLLISFSVFSDYMSISRSCYLVLSNLPASFFMTFGCVVPSPFLSENSVHLSFFPLVLVLEVGGVPVFGLLYVHSLCVSLSPIWSFSRWYLFTRKHVWFRGCTFFRWILFCFWQVAQEQHLPVNHP